MRGSPLRAVVVGLLTIGAGAALLHAAGEDCVLTPACPEDQVGARGCCMMAQHAGGIATLAPAPSTPAAGCPADMVHVAAATFAMGSPDGVGNADEHPRTSTRLAGYCLDRTEVTVAAYAKCVGSGACTAPKDPADPLLMGLCNGSRDDRQQHPINCVSWEQASAYCTFARKRLPREAEWEYAAVGPHAQLYPGGNTSPNAERLNACGSECSRIRAHLRRPPAAMYNASDRWETTAPVASFPEALSPVGALDLDGNVSEWVDDDYRSYTGSASAFRDGVHRVVRGASFLDTDPATVRGTSRGHANPKAGDVTIGFRCAREE